MYLAFFVSIIILQVFNKSGWNCYCSLPLAIMVFFPASPSGRQFIMSMSPDFLASSLDIYKKVIKLLSSSVLNYTVFIFFFCGKKGGCNLTII